MQVAMVMMAKIFTEENWIKVRDAVLTWLMGFGKNLLVALLVLFIGNKLIKWVIKLIKRGSEKSKLEPIVNKFLLSMVKFALYAVLAIVVVGILGIPASSFVTLLGTAGLAVGLALQGSLANFAGGILILLFKPFKIGDYIKEDVHGNEGVVTGIDLLYTKILTIDNKTVTIPNGSLANTSIVNFTAQQKRRIDLDIGISYDADIKLAKDTVIEVLGKQEGILPNEQNVVAVAELAESQITLTVRTWVKTEDYWNIKWELTEKIKLAFDEKNIEIPYNQLAVTIKK